MSLGLIQKFAGSYIPAGYVECDGAQFSKIQYATLYNALGDAFGIPESSEYFCIPDLRPKNANGELLNIQVGELHNNEVYVKSYIYTGF